jgi:hypothetical protein
MGNTAFGTSEDYFRAFQHVLQEGVPEKHRDMISEHFAARGHTVTWRLLAEAVGYPNHQSVNLQYGKFAERVARQLGMNEKPIDPNGYAWWLWAIVDWSNERHESGDQAFVLRPEVVDALRRLGFEER